MTFKVADSMFLRNMLNVLSVVTNEPTFRVDHESVTVRAMDPSHICMIDMQIPRKACESWDYDGPQGGFTFAVDVEKLVKESLKRLKRHESATVTVQATKGEKQSISILLLSDLSKTISRTILEPLVNEYPVPMLVHTVGARLVMQKLVEVVQDIDERNYTYIKIKATPNGITLSGYEGNDEASYSADFEQGSNNVFSYEMQDEVESMYNVDYIMDFLKAAQQISDVVQVQFGHPGAPTANSGPLQLDLEIYPGHTVTMRYFVAPRIDG